MNYRVAGAWHPIEDRLSRGGDGSWHPLASAIPVSFPSSLAAAPIAVGPSDRRFAFTLQGANSAEGSATGAQRTYADVLPHVSATYAASADSIRETLSLASASAPTVYRYKLALSAGLHASLSRGGGVVVANASGKRVYWLAAPTVTDSSNAAHFRLTKPVHYELSTDGKVLSLVLDRAWLTNPSRVFPVKIDPEVFYYEAEDCSIISQSYANNQECGGPLFIGVDSEANVGRAVAHFDLSSVPRDANVLQSRLALWFDWHVGSSALNIEARALTRSFNQEVSWNSYDGTSAWTTAGGDYASTAAGQQALTTSNEGEYVSWGFTPQVEQWIREPSSNHGVLLKAHEETGSTYYAFDQTDNPYSQPEPYMEVVYDPYLGNPPNTPMVQQSIGNGGTLGVNAENGNLNISTPDVAYHGEGYDTEVTRSYNSLDDLLAEGSFHLWRLGPAEDMPIYRTPWDGVNVIVQPDGTDTRFDREPAGDGQPSTGDKAFSSEEGAPTLVEHSDGTRTLTYGDSGNEWHYGSGEFGGYPYEIVDPGGEGNTLSLSYAYEKLTGISDTHGHSLTVTRNPSTGYVTKLKSSVGEEWEYGYDVYNRLTTYKGPEGQEATYSYRNEDDKLTKIVDPSGTIVVSYDGSDRVSSLRRLVNGTVTEVGSEDEITSYKYEAPTSPTCNPETDALQTVVTEMPGEGHFATYCFTAQGELTRESGTVGESEEEAAEFEPQEEVSEGTCYVPAEYCGEEDTEPENEATEEEGESFSLLTTSIPDLAHTQYGLSDNNHVEKPSAKHFNYFANGNFQSLHVKKVRRTVPWDLVYAGAHGTTPQKEELEDVEKWVEKVRALGGGTGQPLISFERCAGTWIDHAQTPVKTESCETPPERPDYELAVTEFLTNPVLGKVNLFTAWNEPNNKTQPTGALEYAKLAGEYWAVLDALCAPKNYNCLVAAGDFSDTKMVNATNGKTFGAKYLTAYWHGMNHPAATRWAWHSYTDGLYAGVVEWSTPSGWWKRFKSFRAQINLLAKGHKRPDIWLSEQGVIVSNEGAWKPGAGRTDQSRIMRAYVEDGTHQLTRQSKQITSFYYYQMRGEAKSTLHQDSGLLSPGDSPRPTYFIYRKKTT